MKQLLLGLASFAVLIGIPLSVDILGQANNTEPISYTQVETKAEPEPKLKSEPKVEIKTETEIESVDFDTIYNDDNTLPKGQNKTVVEGANGEKVYLYQVTYIDGVETDRELIDVNIEKEPTNKVVAVGTKVETPMVVCENGTYKNVDGKEVCSPSTTNTGEATAICRDGKYSYSQHRQGTCSHHGGVRAWL